ncbi:hypothetical protein G7051_17555 [Dysgonomonas sp. HDW5B]|uniref:hypothetical protein n=1 Tax=Dysgonomonas sp. HDW5B TaxID=2714927 RepID=UPI00140CA580|nr:hypothetical protein [Dysgonomonas sp. HDW5B]QIK56067.1 hypothetical protein G7051_17555 [Dysgonomonas sp. HDW5B]
MAKFIEVKVDREKLFIINVDAIQTIERVEGNTEQCLIRFLSGNIEGITINESYSTIKKWLEPDSRIVD